MKRSHNKIRQWHKIRRFRADDKCCQTDLTYPGILTDILLEILIKTPEKHDFWVIFLQYPLRYFSKIVENTCGIFCGCILGKKPCGPLFFKLYRTAPALLGSLRMNQCRGNMLAKCLKRSFGYKNDARKSFRLIVEEFARPAKCDIF